MAHRGGAGASPASQGAKSSKAQSGLARRAGLAAGDRKSHPARASRTRGRQLEETDLEPGLSNLIDGVAGGSHAGMENALKSMSGGLGNS